MKYGDRLLFVWRPPMEEISTTGLMVSTMILREKKYFREVRIMAISLIQNLGLSYEAPERAKPLMLPML